MRLKLWFWGYSITTSTVRSDGGRWFAEVRAVAKTFSSESRVAFWDYFQNEQEARDAVCKWLPEINRAVAPRPLAV